MKSAEGRGRTLDEAVDAALIQLGESRRNVDVKVVSETSDETVVQVSVLGSYCPPTDDCPPHIRTTFPENTVACALRAAGAPNVAIVVHVSFTGL